MSNLTWWEMNALRTDRRLLRYPINEYLTLVELDRLRFVRWRLGTDGVHR